MNFIKLNTAFLDASGRYNKIKGRQMNIERLYIERQMNIERLYCSCRPDSFRRRQEAPSFSFFCELSYNGNKVPKNIPKRVGLNTP